MQSVYHIGSDESPSSTTSLPRTCFSAPMQCSGSALARAFCYIYTAPPDHVAVVCHGFCCVAHLEACAACFHRSLRNILACVGLLLTFSPGLSLSLSLSLMLSLSLSLSLSLALSIKFSMEKTMFSLYVYMSTQ